MTPNESEMEELKVRHELCDVINDWVTDGGDQWSLATKILPFITAAHTRGREEGLEEAAKVAESWRCLTEGDDARNAYEWFQMVANAIAQQIRARLQPQQDEKKE